MYTAEETLEFLESQDAEWEALDPLTYLSTEVADAYDLSGFYPDVSILALNRLAKQSERGRSRPYYWSKVRPQLLEAARDALEQLKVYIESEAQPHETSWSSASDREEAKTMFKSYRSLVGYLESLPAKPTMLQLKVCSLVGELDQDASIGALTMGAAWDAASKLRRLASEYLLTPSNELLDNYVDHVLRYFANDWSEDLSEEESARAKAAQANNARLVAELDALKLLDESGL